MLSKSLLRIIIDNNVVPTRSTFWADIVLLLLLSMVNGFIVILLMTWMQVRTLEQILGRIMVLLMFSRTGLMSIPQAISRVLRKWRLTRLLRHWEYSVHR